MRNSYLSFLLLVVVSGCASVPNSSSFDAKYTQVLDLCNEETFPNSMARPQGFDLPAHLSSLKAQRESLIEQFATQRGITYIENRISSEHDDVRISCATGLLIDAQSFGR